MIKEVEIIEGGIFNDHRGTLSFINDFSFPGVKRFYRITHPDIEIVRAWQGHKIEHKYFYVAAGSYVIAWVKIDDWDNPFENLVAEHHILSAKHPAILSVPAGYANGIKAMEKDSSLIIFSDLNAEDSANDRWSFEPNRWLDWQQFHI